MKQKDWLQNVQTGNLHPCPYEVNWLGKAYAHLLNKMKKIRRDLASQDGLIRMRCDCAGTMLRYVGDTKGKGSYAEYRTTLQNSYLLGIFKLIRIALQIQPL